MREKQVKARSSWLRMTHDPGLIGETRVVARREALLGESFGVSERYFQIRYRRQGKLLPWLLKNPV